MPERPSAYIFARRLDGSGFSNACDLPLVSLNCSEQCLNNLECFVVLLLVRTTMPGGGIRTPGISFKPQPYR